MGSFVCDRRDGRYDTGVLPGRVAAIWLKRFKGGPMDPVHDALLEVGSGIAGNADRGGRRQVTVLEREVWEVVMREVEADLSPSVRRANLLVEGVALARSTGHVLRVGGARLRVGGPTQPCKAMDELWPGLEAALRPDWRGGAFCEVVGAARIAIGDPVAWEP
jgi:MOSC domain-containing protein YiiM